MAMDTEKVYRVIKETLRNFHGAARYVVTHHWRKMNRTEQARVARALVLMEHVADMPARYFSRAHTMDAWQKRLGRNDPLDGGNLKNKPIGPADVLETQVHAAFTWALELRYHYHKFCQAVVDWEYARTASNADARANADRHIDGVRQVVEESRTWRVARHERNSR